MSQSAEAKIAYALRREMRIRRDKTAALLMPMFLTDPAREGSEKSIRAAAELAVIAADVLLMELDRTSKEKLPGGA